LPAVGAYWSDARYNSYYYGVTRKEARKSGLGAYAPGSGFAPYVSFAIDYSLTEQWELFCQGEVTFLSGAVKDSPMVGETHTQSLTLGLTYTF
ncbi:MAG: MipA/OmpV family protein, partial [Bilophila wadsworthia]